MKSIKLRVDKSVYEFMVRNVLLGVMLIFLIIIYVNNGFACERQMRELNKSKEVLRDAEYRYYAAQKKLNSIGVRSSVKMRLKENGSNLEDSKKPSVRI